MIMKISPEERFKELFFNQIEYVDTTYNYNTNKPHRYITFYDKEGKHLGNYNEITNYFWLSEQRIWSVLKSEYNLNNQQISDLTKGMLEEHFNLKEITTESSHNLVIRWLEEDFNLKGFTTADFSNTRSNELEEDFNLKGFTTHTSLISFLFLLEEDFNLKGFTTYVLELADKDKLEEHFNLKGFTT